MSILICDFTHSLLISPNTKTVRVYDSADDLRELRGAGRVHAVSAVGLESDERRPGEH